MQLGSFSWERVIMAVDAVRERTLRFAHALAESKIPYAVVGGNAVAAWVARVDIEAVRNTKDVDVLIDVGLIDTTWRDRLPPELARRLTELMETREQEG